MTQSRTEPALVAGAGVGITEQGEPVLFDIASEAGQAGPKLSPSQLVMVGAFLQALGQAMIAEKRSERVETRRRLMGGGP